MDFDTLLAALAEAGGPWEAADTPVVQLLGQPGTHLFGLALDEDARLALLARAEDLEAMTGMLAADEVVPFHADWRTDGHVTPVRDQGTCGACVAFATCAALEARARIQQGDREFGLDLSEAHLFHCGNPGGCASGWQPDAALAWASEHGIGLERDFPYDATDQPCQPVAAAMKVADWSAAASDEQRRRVIAFHGPVIAGMRVFEDLPHYKTGVYRHVIGEEVGLHAVCVVGYDDAGGYWIVKNSWGTEWGEGGYLRIAYGEGGLDSEFPFLDPDVVLLP